MKLDYQILLKSPPPNVTGWIRPCNDLLHYFTSNLNLLTLQKFIHRTFCFYLAIIHFVSREPLAESQNSRMVSATKFRIFCDKISNSFEPLQLENAGQSLFL